MSVNSELEARKLKKMLSTQRKLSYGEKMRIVELRGLKDEEADVQSYSQISSNVLVKRSTVINVCRLFIKNGRFDLKK